MRVTVKPKSRVASLPVTVMRFAKVIANDDVSLDIYKGEILSLLGENGSGKTTLMNMLAGIYFPDEGEILVNGKPVTISSPKDAFSHGIGMIHQHFKLVDVFTAAENIVLGLEDEGRLDLKAAAAKINEICKKYGFHVDPNKKIYDMSVSEKQTVEIVKVLYRGARILILDEPTAEGVTAEVNSQSTLMRNASAIDNLRWQRCRKRRVSIRFWTAKSNTAKPTPRKNLGDNSILLKTSTSNSRIIIPAMTTKPMEAATHKCHFFILFSK